MQPAADPKQTDTPAVLARLEALLSSGVLTQAEVVSCNGLAEALRRPARVAIFGQDAGDVTGVLASMLGEAVIDVAPGGPAIELHAGDGPRHTATFEDGSSLSQKGYPSADLLQYGPLFLQIETPLAMLETMSFLAVELGADAETYTPALGWAAKRSEIAIFCARAFGDTEAAIWRAAPDRLKNHCYLVITGAQDTASARARGAFDAVIHAPGASRTAAPLAALKHRLSADIIAARREDVDAAELFLHRFRRALDDLEAAAATQAEADAAAEAAPAASASRSDGRPEPKREPEPEADPGRMDALRVAARKLVSGPILHLKRRSRALAEILEWREQDENWSEEVLEHCAETAEALRDLVASWPDDDPMATRLRDAVDQACDTVVLLQMEAGPDQAADAARVLYQLRTDFEQEMAA